MKVESKFLTADVRVVSVSLDGSTLVVEGIVKEFMPMTVRISPDDGLEMIRALSKPLRQRLAAIIPARFRSGSENRHR